MRLLLLEGDEQIVDKGAQDPADQDIGSLLAGRTHPQGNHLCSGSKRDDGCPDGSLTNPNNLSESKSTFYNSWTSHRHCCQTTKGQQDRFPMQARARMLLLVTIIVVVFRLYQTLDRLPVCPKEEYGVADKHEQQENPFELGDNS